MKFVAMFVALVLMAVTGARAQSTPVIRGGEVTQLEVAQAVARVPRLAIDRFAALPPTAREAFSQMNCRVPQTTVAASPHNVIAGEFAAPGQRDWAALCSDGSTSEIRVVWGGPAQCLNRVAARQDVDVMRADSPGTFAFGRALAIANVEHLQRSIARNRKPLPEAPSHDGIEDGGEKGGIVYYCHQGNWVTVPGGN